MVGWVVGEEVHWERLGNGSRLVAITGLTSPATNFTTHVIAIYACSPRATHQDVLGKETLVAIRVLPCPGTLRCCLLCSVCYDF